MIVTSPLAASAFGYDTNATPATVTVPAGCTVVMFTCAVATGGAAGSVTIVAKGPKQGLVSPAAVLGAGGAIPVPAGSTFSREWPIGGPLAEGTTIAFAGTSTYYVEYQRGAVGG